jgi:hypothetical protein
MRVESAKYVERYESRTEAEARSDELANKGCVVCLAWEAPSRKWRLTYTDTDAPASILDILDAPDTQDPELLKLLLGS